MSAVELLQKLGDSAEQVAASLRAKGIRGKCNSAEHCPLARYLKPYCGTCYVTQNRVCDMLGQHVTPDAASWFIVAFDGGLFPDLIEA